MMSTPRTYWTKQTRKNAAQTSWNRDRRRQRTFCLPPGSHKEQLQDCFFPKDLGPLKSSISVGKPWQAHFLVCAFLVVWGETILTTIPPLSLDTPRWSLMEIHCGLLPQMGISLFPDIFLGSCQVRTSGGTTECSLPSPSMGVVGSPEKVRFRCHQVEHTSRCDHLC